MAGTSFFNEKGCRFTGQFKTAGLPRSDNQQFSPFYLANRRSRPLANSSRLAQILLLEHITELLALDLDRLAGHYRAIARQVARKRVEESRIVEQIADYRQLLGDIAEAEAMLDNWPAGGDA